MVVAAEGRAFPQVQPDSADPVRTGIGRGSPARLPAEAWSGRSATDGEKDSRLSGAGQGVFERSVQASPPLTDSATALLQAIRGHFVHAGFELEEIRSRRWSSVTFRGARHELAFRLDGEGAEAAAGRFLSGLGARRFSLRGHLVADVSLVAEERRPGFARIRLDVLTVEEG